MGIFIDGKSIALEVEQGIKSRVSALKKNQIPVKLGVILVGTDKPSETYVQKKSEAARTVGIDFQLEMLSESATTADVCALIEKLQTEEELSGLIVQLPLPKHIETDIVLNTIRPDIDVDCLTKKNIDLLEAGTPYVEPPTPSAILEILASLNASVANKRITIIGAGRLVGKPLATMLKHRQALVTVCTNTTMDTKEKTLSADIIVSAVGKRNLITADMIRPGAIVIDAGVSFHDEKAYGDVNMDEVIHIVSYVTPTPGGVGPVTVAELLQNTVICAERKKGK